MTAGPDGGVFYGLPYTPGAAGAGGVGAAAAQPQVAAVQASVQPVNGSPQLVATLGPVPPSSLWLVRRITVQASAACSAYVYVGGLLPANIVSGTASGDFDENDTNQPIIVPCGQELAVVWTLASGTALARVEYQQA